jgi:hypothetical protein
VTAQRDLKAFGSADSYGYRTLLSARYNDAFAGFNLDVLGALFHDVKGTGPGIGQNFVEGRKQALTGLRLEYLIRYSADLRYTWYFGGGGRDALTDRDNVSLSVGYQF